MNSKLKFIRRFDESPVWGPTKSSKAARNAAAQSSRSMFENNGARQYFPV